MVDKETVFVESKNRGKSYETNLKFISDVIFIKSIGFSFIILFFSNIKFGKS